MPPFTLAETILRDVKRYSLNMLAIEMFETPHGGWVKLPAVEAALSAHLDPAIAERAGELAQSDDPKVMLYHGEYVEALRSLLAQNAALRAERDGLLATWSESRERHLAAEAREERLRGALEKIAAEASVPVHTWKNGINFKKMYEGWRKIATERIDIARAALTETATTEEGHDG